jgi:hypothetical protein
MLLIDNVFLFYLYIYSYNYFFINILLYIINLSSILKFNKKIMSIKCFFCNQKILVKTNQILLHYIIDLNKNIDNINICLVCKKKFIIKFKNIFSDTIMYCLSLNENNVKIEEHFFLDKNKNIFIYSTNVIKLFKFIIGFIKNFSQIYLFNIIDKNNKIYSTLDLLLKIDYIVFKEIFKLLLLFNVFNNDFNKLHLNNRVWINFYSLFEFCYREQILDIKKIVLDYGCSILLPEIIDNISTFLLDNKNKVNNFLNIIRNKINIIFNKKK